MTAFTINRDLWLRGTGTGMLYNGQPRQCMCCLGQIGEQCGVSREAMRDVGLPSHLNDPSPWPNGMRGMFPDEDGDMEQEAAAINDDARITDTIREAQLRRLFADHEITLAFVDGLPCALP